MVEEERGPKLRATYLGVGEFGEDISGILGRVLKALTQAPLVKLRSMVVFGSRARGDWKPWSDTDVVLIVEVKKPLKWGTLWELGLPEDVIVDAHRAYIEPRIFTPEGFRRALSLGSLTALDALEEGVVLYDDGYWREMKELFSKMKRSGQIEKMPFGWKIRTT